MADHSQWRIAAGRLQAPAWAWALTAVAATLFAGLGTWQLQRGLAKERIQAQLADAGAPALELSGRTPAAAAGTFQRAQATGLYLPGYQLLQDGQSHRQAPGYHVWTPLRLLDGNLVLVNRGWIPQPADLRIAPDLPAPAGTVTVTGWWRSLPEPGVRVGDAECRPPEAFPAAVIYPTARQLGCLLGQEPLAGLLLQDPREPDGFVREWTAGGVSPARHYGYAVQWYALGVAAVVLFVFLNLKRDPWMSPQEPG